MNVFKKIGKGIKSVVAFFEPAVKIGLEVVAAVAPVVIPGAGIAISAAAAAGAYGLDQYEKHEDRKENRIKEQAALEAATRERDEVHQQLLANEQAEQNRVAAEDTLAQQAIAQHYAAAHDHVDQQHAQIAYDMQQQYSKQREIIKQRPGAKVAVGVAANAGTTGYSINLTHGAGVPGKMVYGSVEVYNHDYASGSIAAPEIAVPPSTYDYEPEEPVIASEDPVIIPETTGVFKPAVIHDRETTQLQDTPVAAIAPAATAASASGWCNLAWRALTGEESAEIMRWQAANRENVPQIAEFLGGVSKAPAQRVVNAFADPFNKQVFVKPARFLGEEAARYSLGEQTQTAHAAQHAWDVVKQVPDFIGSEAARFVTGEATETGMFFENIGNFVAADFTRLRNGQETVIGTAITNDFQALTNMSAEELAGYLGHESGNAVLFLFAGGGIKAGTKVLGSAIDTVQVVSKELAAGYEFRSPLVFQFEGGRLNTGLPVDAVKVRNPWIKKKTEITEFLDNNRYLYYPNLHIRETDLIAIERKLSELQTAQTKAVKIITLPDGRVRYYGPFRPQHNPGPTSGASFVTEYNPISGQVRSWFECYDQKGVVNRIHPKTLDGHDLNLGHYPPIERELLTKFKRE